MNDLFNAHLAIKFQKNHRNLHFITWFDDNHNNFQILVHGCPVHASVFKQMTSLPWDNIVRSDLLLTFLGRMSAKYQLFIFVLLAVIVLRTDNFVAAQPNVDWVFTEGIF